MDSLRFRTPRQSKKCWPCPFTRWTAKKSTRSTQRPKTAQKPAARPRRYSWAASARIPPRTKWRRTSASSARSRKQWCWWISIPNGTVASGSWRLKTTTLWTPYARSISIRSRIRKWSARRRSPRSWCSQPQPRRRACCWANARC